MDPGNKREALREATHDEEEGADIMMVKPALAYLDIIHVLREKSTLPIAVGVQFDQGLPLPVMVHNHDRISFDVCFLLLECHAGFGCRPIKSVGNTR